MNGNNENWALAWAEVLFCTFQKSKKFNMFFACYKFRFQDPCSAFL